MRAPPQFAGALFHGGYAGWDSTCRTSPAKAGYAGGVWTSCPSWTGFRRSRVIPNLDIPHSPKLRQAPCSVRRDGRTAAVQTTSGPGIARRRVVRERGLRNPTTLRVEPAGYCCTAPGRRCAACYQITCWAS